MSNQNGKKPTEDSPLAETFDARTVVQPRMKPGLEQTLTNNPVPTPIPTPKPQPTPSPLPNFSLEDRAPEPPKTHASGSGARVPPSVPDAPPRPSSTTSNFALKQPLAQTPEPVDDGLVFEEISEATADDDKNASAHKFGIPKERLALFAIVALLIAGVGLVLSSSLPQLTALTESDKDSGSSSEASTGEKKEPLQAVAQARKPENQPAQAPTETQSGVAVGDLLTQFDISYSRTQGQARGNN